MNEQLRWRASRREDRDEEILDAAADSERPQHIATRLRLTPARVLRVVARARQTGDPRAQRLPLWLLRMAARQDRLARLARIERRKAQE